MDMDKSLVFVSSAVVFKEHRGKLLWFIVKEAEESLWEFPKVVVRKGESSVRAALRTTAERGFMTTRVLEETGRAGGVTTINGKILPQRHLYYLMILLSESGEPIGFANHEWIEYGKAVRKLGSKREVMMLRQANKIYKKWKKENPNFKKDIEEET